MDNEWMLWWIFAPVGVDELEDILRDAIEMGGTLGIDQVVLGVHVDAMLWLPSRHLRHGKWRSNLDQTCSSLVIILKRKGQTGCQVGQEVSSSYTFSLASLPIDLASCGKNYSCRR